MTKLEKATDFYLRGFGSQYIKRRTGISMQSLLKQLKALGLTYTKDDIVKYQIEYVKSRYSYDDIAKAYEYIVTTFDDPYKASRGRHIEVLGCGFGNYKKVFVSVIGDEAYAELRNKFWKIKQTKTVRSKYGCDNVFCKEVFDTVVTDEAIKRGRLKREKTLIEKYGVPHPLQNEELKNKMIDSLIATNQSRYGVNGATQVPEIAKKANAHRQETMLKKYGVANSMESPDIAAKVFTAMKENGTLHTSKPEKLMGQVLVHLFGADDVLHNVIVDKRYPYRVDYYIKSLDLFIELNGNRCHNDHWFDKNSKRDLQIVNDWHRNMIKREKETGKRSRYRKYIETWTQTDIEKKSAAEVNNLNYLVFWDGSSKSRRGKMTPVLSDFYDWINDGCPMPKDWRPENTY